ncbi:MAG: VOC family protein [Steroidobacteraceae bacterium]
MVLDCVDPEALAAFWTQALGYERAGAVEQFVVLRGDEGDTPLLLQRVPESKQVKNRMHVDIHVPDVESKVRELETAGATRRAENSIGEMRWITMTDPEGNEFCVCPG